MTSAFTAFYAAGAMMLAGAFGRAVLPLGEDHLEASRAGDQLTLSHQFELGEPGAKQRQ